MNINEFVEQEQLLIAQFKEWWLAQHKKDPENFPLKTLPGDWHEQLFTFDPSWLDELGE